MVEYTRPENAPEHCPGVQNEMAGKADACAGCPNQSICASGEARKENPGKGLLVLIVRLFLVVEEVRVKLAGVKNVVLVLSGKGGVGKSTVAT